MTEPTLHDKLIFTMQNDPTITSPTELTGREKEILRLVATGTSNKDIAHQLFISSNTVKVHIRNIFAKIGVVSRTEAAMYAVRTGLVQTATSPTKPADELGKALPELEQDASTPALETTLRRGWLSRYWVIVVLVILALGFVSGMGIFFTQHPASSPVVTPLPSPTATSRWKRFVDMPTARSGMAIAAYENKIYAIGGATSQGVTGAVESYDPETNSWQKKSAKPLAVSDVGAVAIGGKIYIPGGRLGSGNITNILEIYDPRQDRWERGATMPIALSAYASVAFEGRLYLFGGWDGKRYLNSVYLYDAVQDHWKLLAKMPEMRAFAGAAVAGDKIYVIGGFDGEHALTINEVYTPFLNESENPWTQAAPMPVGRYAFGIASIADDIYILGGKSEDKGLLNPLLYNSQAAKWQEYELPPVSIGNEASLAPLGQYLYAFGGNSDNGTSGYNLAYQAIYSIIIPFVK